MLLTKRLDQQEAQISMLKAQVMDVMQKATAAQVTTEMQLQTLLDDTINFCTDLQAICSGAEQTAIEAENTAGRAMEMATAYKFAIANNPAFNQTADGKTVLQMMARTITLLPEFETAAAQVDPVAKQAITLYGQQGEVPKRVFKFGEGGLVETEKRLTKKKTPTLSPQSQVPTRMGPRAPTLKVPGKSMKAVLDSATLQTQTLVAAPAPVPAPALPPPIPTGPPSQQAAAAVASLYRGMSISSQAMANEDSKAANAAVAKIVSSPAVVKAVAAEASASRLAPVAQNIAAKSNVSTTAATAAKTAQQRAIDAIRSRLGMNSGGIVPKYFADGGYGRGTDTIPAMLTPGEFVVRRSAVDSLGIDTMNNINNGQVPSGSVYNYNLSVNVSNTNANANDIARTVINQIRQIDSQRIRSFR